MTPRNGVVGGASYRYCHASAQLRAGCASDPTRSLPQDPGRPAVIHLALWIVSAIIVGSTAPVALIAVTVLIRWLVLGVCRAFSTPIYAPPRAERFIKWANRGTPSFSATVP